MAIAETKNNGGALGLMFLKYISDSFEAKHKALLLDDPAAAEDRDEYAADNVFCPRLPKALPFTNDGGGINGSSQARRRGLPERSGGPGRLDSLGARAAAQPDCPDPFWADPRLNPPVLHTCPDRLRGPRQMTVNTWERLRDTIERLFPNSVVGRLNPPATDAQMRAAEAALGMRLPRDLREAYLHANGTCGSGQWGVVGDRVPCLFLPFYDWAPLEWVVDTWRLNREVAARNPSIRTHLPTPGPGDAVWDGGWLLPQWTPIGDARMSTFVACDMRPGPAGKHGQIIQVDLEDASSKVIGSGFEPYIRRLLDAIDAGALVSRDGDWYASATGMRAYSLEQVGF